MSNCDTKFLEKLLRNTENDPTITITNIKKERACKKGENFMSIVERITLEGYKTENNNRVDYKTGLIVKNPFQSQIMQTDFKSNDIFMNEEVAYNEIIPMLNKYFKLTLPIADCLFASKDVIILKDLSKDGFQMRAEAISMNVEQCVAIMQELASLHSASIILKKHKPNKIKKVSGKIVEIYNRENKFISDLFDKSVSMAILLLKKTEQTETITKAIKTIETYQKKIYERVCELLETKTETAVFNHGDCWRNNILFKDSSVGLKVKLVDLQMMRYTSVAADLSYFLYINLSPEERNRNLDLLLDVYLNALHRSISEHGLHSDVQFYSKDWLVNEMADFAAFGFMCSLWIAPAFYIDKDTFPDMESLKPEEVDVEYQKDFVLNNMTPALKDRIVSLVLDFVNKINF